MAALRGRRGTSVPTPQRQYPMLRDSYGTASGAVVGMALPVTP
jgi:hypothetical protein